MANPPLPIFIDSLGALTPVGLNVPQVMGSLRTGVDFFQELQVMGPQGEPVVGAAVPLAEGVLGLDRSAALLGSALRECVGRRPRRPVPLFLVLPEASGPELSWPALLQQAQQSAGVELDVPASACFSQGGAGTVHALSRAAQLLQSGRHEACYVAAVDSRLHRSALAALLLAGRVRGPDSSDGLIPGEAAVCVRLSAARGPTSVARVMGLGSAQAPGPRGGAGAVGAGVDAARQALAQARVSMGEVAVLASDVNGERAPMRERGLALARLRPRRPAAQGDWTPAMSVGDVGAASGLLALAYLAFRHGHDPGLTGPSLWMGASEGGLRSAVVLASV